MCGSKVFRISTLKKDLWGLYRGPKERVSNTLNHRRSKSNGVKRTSLVCNLGTRWNSEYKI